MNATHPTLATRFGRNVHVLRSEQPLADDQIRRVAPSVFAEGKHASRSERYTYIPTIDVLRGLRREGFEPYMVAQGNSLDEERRAYTKHLLRLRYQGHVQAVQSRARDTANEIILINSHDGRSCYQMLAGMFRFVCCNGLVVGDVVDDIRIPHKGDVRGEVIEGAFRVLDEFDEVEEHAEAMKALPLEHGEEIAFATAALALRFGERALEDGGHLPAPVTAEQLIEARRPEDLRHDLWTTFQRVQENTMHGGLPGRAATGRHLRTQPVKSIDRGVSLNRALWMLAEEMRKLKA